MTVRRSADPPTELKCNERLINLLNRINNRVYGRRLSASVAFTALPQQSLTFFLSSLYLYCYITQAYFNILKAYAFSQYTK